MKQVVQATCPGCKKVLRIPADWVQQAVKCKHCGTVIQTRARPTAAPQRPQGTGAGARAAEQSPFAELAAADATAPVAAPPPAAPRMRDAKNTPAEEDVEPEAPRPRKRGSRGGGWAILILLWIGALAIIGVAAVLIVPRLLAPRTDSQAQDNEDEGGGGSGGGGGESDAGQRPQGGGQRRATRDGFPNRRAFLISVNYYLYCNPTAYGSTGALADRLNAGLSIPREQVVLLNDSGAAQSTRPSRQVVDTSLDSFLKGARKQDCLLIFFSGHVVEIDKEPYLVPYDGEADNKDSLIGVKSVLERLAASPARQKVLVLDVCRLNPAKEPTRPASGSEEPKKDLDGALWAKLDEMLKEPPEGVQVWVSCLADQYSYELDEGGRQSAVFVDALVDALAKSGEGKIQRPEEPFVLDTLVSAVNARMKEHLSTREKQQTSRLSGTSREGTYDPREAPAPRFEVKPPPLEGGPARSEDVKNILSEIDIPPIRHGRPEMRLGVEAFPPFAAKVLEDYRDSADKNPLRDAVVKARNVLRAQRQLAEEVRAPGPNQNEQQFKNELLERSKNVTRLLIPLDDALAELKKLESEKAKAPKRWQAHYDYVLARVQMDIAYLWEYLSLLGSMRKELPERDAKVHDGWRMASVKEMTGDATGKKALKEARKIFTKMGEDYPGTPWEILAKRERTTSVGMDWQATKVGR